MGGGAVLDSYSQSFSWEPPGRLSPGHIPSVYSCLLLIVKGENMGQRGTVGKWKGKDKMLA